MISVYLKLNVQIESENINKFENKS